jgi:4-hydroxy-tetrahydrodipicolinate synthase
MMFRGTTTALVTPFTNGKVDYTALTKLVEFQIASGINGILVCGSTGESNNLSFDDRVQIIATTLKIAKGVVPIMVGTGTASTSETIELSKTAEDLGADAALVTVPFYVKPSQQGMIAHFAALSDNIDLPIYVYNNPGRAVVDASLDTLFKIAELKNIKGLKEDLERALLLKKHFQNSDFELLCGDDAAAHAFIACGWHGVVSVTSNVLPNEISKAIELALKGQYNEALKLTIQYVSMHEAMFCESSPAPAKFALHALGLINNELRLPLLPLSHGNEKRITALLQDLGKLK